MDWPARAAEAVPMTRAAASATLVLFNIVVSLLVALPDSEIGGWRAGSIIFPFKETKLKFNASRRSGEGRKPYWKPSIRPRCFAATISEVDATISDVDSATNRRTRHTRNDKVAMRVPMSR